MAHPYASHQEKYAGRKKAHERVHGYKKGGAVHGDEKEDRKLFGKMMKEHDDKVHGKNKFARGGRAKDKKGGNHVNIAIVNPRAGGDKGGAPMGGPPAGMPAPPPPRPPIGAGAGAPPPGGMTPPMKRGGKVRFTAGSDSGVGRKQKARAAR